MEAPPRDENNTKKGEEKRLSFVPNQNPGEIEQIRGLNKEAR